jgi:hypothetical protein
MKARTYTEKGYVRVIVRAFKGEIVALFPDLPADVEARHCTCYAHVGQHSAANLAYVLRHSRPATVAEKRPLLQELAGQGYKLVERVRHVRVKAEDPQ